MTTHGSRPTAIRIIATSGPEMRDEAIFAEKAIAPKNVAATTIVRSARCVAFFVSVTFVVLRSQLFVLRSSGPRTTKNEQRRTNNEERTTKVADGSLISRCQSSRRSGHRSLSTGYGPRV